jgi:hypothetical protein
MDRLRRRFFLLSRRSLRSYGPVPLGLHRFFQPGVAAARLLQTANQGQSRPALRRDQPAADAWACALENHTFLTSALQSDAITLPRAVGVRCRLEARAAAGQAPLGPILFMKPSRAEVQSKRRSREPWRTGASRDQRPQQAVARSTLGRARPWRASVRPCGSPAGSAKFSYGAGIGRVSSGDRFGWEAHRRLGGGALSRVEATCPEGGAMHRSRFRWPSSIRQALWGGERCAACGCEYDKWGRRS